MTRPERVPVPAVDKRPKGAPSRSTPDSPSPLTAPPAVPQPTPAALAALDTQIRTVLGDMERIIRDSFESDVDWTPALESAVQAAHDASAALLAAARRGAGDWTQKESSFIGQLTNAKSALENWGRHHSWCEHTLVTPDASGTLPPCTCGLAEAVRHADPSYAIVRAVGHLDDPATSLDTRSLAARAAHPEEPQHVR